MPKEMHRLYTAMLVLIFLTGAVLFIMPVVTELESYQQDAEEYAAIAAQFHPPEPTPPVVIPMPLYTVKPAAEESPVELPEIHINPLVYDLNLDQSDVPIAEPETEAPVEQSELPAITEQPLTTNRPITQEPTATTVPVKPTKAPAAGVDLDACIRQNKDFVAWITIPGTVIDYPVVRSNNTEYYLHHLFSGKESKLGSLFSLKSSDYATPSRNIAIYGHHLSNSNAMFSTLMEYKSAAYYNKHSLIRLETLFGTRQYRIFAVLNMNVSDWDAATAAFSSDDEFLRFVNRAKEKSFYDTGIKVDAADHILTLITCDRSYGGASGRLIVMAVQE